MGQKILGHLKSSFRKGGQIVKSIYRYCRRRAGRILLVAHILGALTSVKAIMETRTSQGAIAWAVSLNSMPLLAVPAYWVFGRDKFNGYVNQRRAELAKVNSAWPPFIADLEKKNLLTARDTQEPYLVEKLAMLPATRGNDAEILIDGHATFQSIFEGIKKAESYVLVQFYIIRADKVGNELKDCLIERSQNGVKCHLLYDEIGSRLPKSYLSELRENGVEVFPFNSTQGPTNRFQLNFRNHRKIVVVDGKEAWVGGLNVGKEYKGLDLKYGDWRDTHLKLAGPVVQCIQIPFVEDWQWATKTTLSDLNWDSQAAESGKDFDILCLPTGPADELETCTLFFLNLINQAKERLWIASPYFVPAEQFISALKLAALRGVDVRILMPKDPDSILVGLSGWSYLADLESVGIRVFHYTKGFMHHKVTLVDQEFSTIGTANFDNRSFRLNFEITMAFASQEMAGRVENMLEKDFRNSTEVNAGDLEEKGFFFNLATRASRLMSPLQ